MSFLGIADLGGINRNTLAITKFRYGLSNGALQSLVRQRPGVTLQRFRRKEIDGTPGALTVKLRESAMLNLRFNGLAQRIPFWKCDRHEYGSFLAMQSNSYRTSFCLLLGCKPLAPLIYSHHRYSRSTDIVVFEGAYAQIDLEQEKQRIPLNRALAQELLGNRASYAGFAKRLSDNRLELSDYEDVLQEAWIRLSSSHETSQNPSNQQWDHRRIVGIVLATIRHVISDLQRKERATKRGRFQTTAIPRTGIPVSGSQGKLETSEALMAILTPRQRIILRLAYFEGRSPPDIASEIGLSLRTVQLEFNEIQRSLLTLARK